MTRGMTGHTCAAAKRTVTREILEERRAALLAQPPSSDRTRRLTTLRGQISRLQCRSDRA